MSYTSQEITDAIAAIMDRAQNKAIVLRSVLSMVNARLDALAVPAGAAFLFGAGVPATALGDEGDVYDNTLTGDRYSKQADGTWLFQYRAKGDAGYTPRKGVDYRDGYTPVKGVDYRDGRDGESAYQLWLDQGNTGSVAVFLASLSAGTATAGQDGTIWHLENYDPAATDGNDGDFWETNVSLTSERRYKKIAGTWRKYYDNTGAAATPSTLAVTLAIGVASVTAGTPVIFTATATGGATPYNFEVTATNTATGSSLVIGAGSSGSWTPNAPGVYDIAATVTDAAGASKTSVTRTLTVTAVADQPPVASAGSDSTITLPTSQVQLMGSGSDPDAGDTVSFQWAQVTGPNTAILATPNLANTTASGLIAGSYQFSLTVTDNHGVSGTKSYVVVHVNAPAVPTLGAPTPNSGLVGSTVTLPGTGLANTTGYTFNGVAGLAAGITANTATSITLAVPQNATGSGSITVTTAGGTATSSAAFTVLPTGSTDAPIGYIFGQSNSSGLAPISGLATAPKGPFPNVIIWNPFTQQGEPLQIGVNELGLNGADLAALGTPGYEDGFGVEYQYALDWTRDHPGQTIYLMKYGDPSGVTTTQLATIERWSDILLSQYETQVANFKAWLVTQGKTPKNAWAYWNQGESNSGSTDYNVKLPAFITRCRTEFAGTTTPFFIQEVPATSATIQTVQRDYAAYTANTYLLPKDGITLLAKDNTHYDTAGMELAGERLYRGTQAPVSLPPSGTTDSPLASAFVPVIFEPRQAGISYVGGIYDRTGAGLTDQNSTGLATSYSPPNTTTCVVAQYNGVVNTGASLAFSRSYTRTPLQSADYVVYLDDVSGCYQILRSGTPVSTNIPIAGAYFGLQRGDHTGRIQVMAGASPATVTPVYTYNDRVTDGLFVQMNLQPGRLEQPQIAGGSAVPIAAGKLVLAGAGVAQADGANTLTPAFTAWVKFTPSVIAGYQMLLTKGVIGSSEEFFLCLNPDASLTGRVHVGSQFPGASLSRPSGFALGSGGLVLIQADATGARVYVNGGFLTFPTGGTATTTPAPFAIGSFLNADGSLTDPANGIFENPGWINRLLTDPEIADLDASGGVPSAALLTDPALVVASTLQRALVSDLTSPNAADNAHPLVIHAGTY